MKGKVILLDGVTSSGKTTTAKRIREIADEEFYYLSADMFEEMIATKRWNADGYSPFNECLRYMFFSARGRSQAMASMR